MNGRCYITLCRASPTAGQLLLLIWGLTGERKGAQRPVRSYVATSGQVESSYPGELERFCKWYANLIEDIRQAELRVFSEAWAFSRVTRLFPRSFCIGNRRFRSVLRSSDRYNVWQSVHLRYVDGVVRSRKTTDVPLRHNEAGQAGGVVEGTRLILPEEHLNRASECPITREKVDWLVSWLQQSFWRPRTCSTEPICGAGSTDFVYRVVHIYRSLTNRFVPL